MSNLTRSSVPTTLITEPLLSMPKDEGEEDHLVPIMSRGSVKITSPTATTTRARRIGHGAGRTNRNFHVLQPSSGLCLAVTGFALDGAHLVRCVAESVANHEYVYGWGGGGSPASSGLDVHRMVREDLAPKMRDAAFVGGGRPFGVDALVVGTERRGVVGEEERVIDSMVMYTLDPSGNWKHWGGGATCIGKGAELVRKQLYQTLYCKDDDDEDNDEKLSIRRKHHYPKTWAQALEIAMEATFKVMDLDELADDKQDSSNETTMADYDAVVLFGNDSGAGRRRVSRCAVIDRQFIAETYRKCADNARQKRLRKEEKKSQK